MSSFRWILLIPILSHFVYNVEAGTRADCLAAVTQAQISMNRAAGINETLNWNNPFALRTALENVFSAPNTTYSFVEGYRRVCRGVKQFKSYMYDSYDQCVNVLTLIADDNNTATGVSEADARFYISILTQFDFACGAGYSVFINNANCFASAFQSRNAFDLCYTDFWSEVNQTPPDTPNVGALYCDYLRRAIDCLGVYIFRPACPSSAANAANYYGCEYMRNHLFYLFPYCTQVECAFGDYRVAAPPQ